MQQQLVQSDDLGFCPSFNCYSSDTQASTAATRISNQLLQQNAPRLLDDEDFEFKLMIGDKEFVAEGIEVFPVFNRDLHILNHVGHEIVRTKHEKDEKEEEEVVSMTTSLETLFLNEREQPGSSCSSEDDEPEGEAPTAFCVWRHKNDAGASPLSKCKKSRSTGSGSGSRRWRIRDLLRRSNSEGKEPMVMFAHKKNEVQKQKLISHEVVGKLKQPLSPSVHEVFYVQQRAKREGVKRRSYLPYRQGLVGFFSNVDGKGKKSLF